MIMISITVLSFFGAGMENSDAAQMVSKWGCNNIVLGIYLTIMLLMMNMIMMNMIMMTTMISW